MTKSLQFLSGGGEMGALMRAYDWESSPIGPADKWPQSFLTTLGILLNSKFPMFLFWGLQHVFFYNDAYRPSLVNEGKHPSILGIKGEKAWPEIWHIIKPLLDQVLTNGEATWSEDQLMPIYRNGKMADVYWTFSYSPVKDESGLPAGVFVTCNETTEKVNNLKKLAESNNQLNFAIEATELGTWDYNPVTNKFIGNNRLKDWFGLPHEEDIDLLNAINGVAENHRIRVSQAIQKALKYESGGFYDVEYSIINPITKQERIVRAKGKAWFGEDKKAYRFNGTLQDITQEAIARKKIEESEQRFRNLILQAPVLINTFQGPSFIVETINKTALEIWGKSYEQVINKPLFDSSPELEDRLKKILNDVYTTGEPFIANEIPVQLKRTGKPDMVYFNTVYQPLRDLDNKIYGIIVIGTEVTEAVNARKQIEASEAFKRTILESSPDCIKILDIEGRIQYMNFSAMCLMEIDDFSTIKNKNWWTLWGSENEALLKASVDKALAGETAQFTAFCPTAKGTPKWWDVVVSPVVKPGEAVQQIISISRDITEKKKSEEAIEKMAAHLKLATDSANVGVWSLDIRTQNLEWSALHKKIWGYDEHRTDLTYEDWHKLILPEDKEMAFKKVEDARINHSFYEVEYRINKADDDVIHSILSVGKYYYNDKGEAETLTGISVDITHQKESELKLKISEEKYRGLFEAIDQGLSIIEMIFDETNKPIDYRFIENNAVFHQQTGLQDVSGKTAREVIPALDNFWFETYGKVALTGKSIRFTQKADALSSWFDVYAFRLGDKGSKKVAILFTNITNRKKAEHKLQASEELFRVLTHNSPDIITRLDKDGRYLYASPSIKKLTGKNAEEFIGRKYREAGLAEHICQLFDKYIPLVLQENKLHTIEFTAMNGLELYSRLVPEFNEKGEAVSVMMIHADITERKQAEEKIKESEKQFRIFADSIQNLAWIAKADGWIYFYNQQWYDYTGTTLEEMEGWGWEKVHHPDHVKKVLEFLKEAWKKDEAFELTFPLRRHDGEYRWFLTRAYPVKDANGNIERWIGTNTDITEQKSFSEELEKKVNERTEELAYRTKQLEEINQTLDLKNIELENVNAELESFTYIASHDLQEPLRKIQTFSKRIIEAEIFSDKTQDYFNRIITASQRMQNLIVSLLDFSRTDRAELIIVPCDLNAIVEESKSDLHLNIVEKQAIIEYENLPTINGLHIQLSQLFTNLIDNAIKYSRPEIVPHIKITAERIYGKEIGHPAAIKQLEYYAIKIADNGIGFHKEYATKIFEVFQRLHGRNAYSGTGIGLAIVKKIIINHNGFIIAAGKPNVGSTFTLYIPTALTKYC